MADKIPPAHTPTHQSEGTRALRVFLCHASSDKPAVRDLYRRLRADGVEVWFDEEDLLPGEKWELAIRQAVRAADVVIVCLSQAAVTSAGYRHKEINLALDVADQQPEGTISVIPLRLEECSIPDRLSHLHWVNLFDEGGYERLMRALRYRANEIKVPVAPTLDPQPTPLPQVLPPRSPSLESLWQDAQTAFYSKQWAQAETYLRRVLAMHANYKDAQAKLTEVTRQLQVQMRYQEIAALRATGDWKEVLTRLHHLIQDQPDFQDTLELRDWAKSRQRRQQLYDSALEAFDAKNWTAARTALTAVLKEFPNDVAAQNLLARARAEQQAQVHPADLLRSGQVESALDQIEHILKQYPYDPEAILMLRNLIELSHIPLEQRRRSATLLASAGDPRPGICTFEPTWCDEIPDGEYPIAQAGQAVHLNNFRIARYPVTVWQFRQFWEMGGYADECCWTPHGWAWKQQQEVSEPFRWTDLRWTLANQPVIGVSWYEAAAFCTWLTARGHKEGWLTASERIRLPSEAEWLIAASWDRDSQRMLPWAPESLDWLNSDDHDPPFDQPTPVDLFPPGITPCGALDMAGNVWEWCASPDADYPLGTGAVVADFAANQASAPVRGGSFKEPARRCGWQARRILAANTRADDVGFRVCWTRRIAMNTIVEHGGFNHKKGLERLKAHLHTIGERSNDFYVYEARLIEALKGIHLYSSNEAQTERRIVVDRLNNLALEKIGVSYNDLCLADTFLQNARKILAEGLKKNAIEDLQEAIRNLQTFIQCEVPSPFRRGLTNYEKDLANIQSHIEFIENYQQLAPFRHEDNWQEVIAQYNNIQHFRYPTAPPDIHGFLAWAQLQAESQVQCDEMQKLLDSGNCLAALQQCRKLKTKIAQEKQFKTIASIVAKVDELETQALEQEVAQALQDEDWFRAVRILRSLYQLNRTRNDVKRRIREQLQHHLRDYFEQSLEWFFVNQDRRPGIVSLDIVWGHALPLPNANTFVKEKFQIAQFPVTVWQFRQFVVNNGYQAAPENKLWTALGSEWRDDEQIHVPYGWEAENRPIDNQPVTNVSWYEAQAFCRWLTARQRVWGWLTQEEEVRLPTKDEWQIAAKRFPGTDDDKPWDKYGLFMRRSYSDLGRDCPMPVGLFPENVSPCGAYDMAGNVWEWCSSGQRDGMYAEGPEDDFDSLEDVTDLCGGSYLSEDNQAHWDGEMQSAPHKQKADFGFRLCRSPIRKVEVE